MPGTRYDSGGAPEASARRMSKNIFMSESVLRVDVNHLIVVHVIIRKTVITFNNISHERISHINKSGETDSLDIAQSAAL